MDDMNHMEPMNSGLPEWLITVSWIYLAICIVSAVAIVVDVAMRRGRGTARGFDLIWAIAALYLGPLAIPAYASLGRHRPPGAEAPSPLRPNSSTARALAGGTASGLAHLVVVPFVVLTGITLFGMDMWAMIAIITVVATSMVYVYERSLLSAGNEATNGTPSPLTAAFVTIISFDVGMLGWMLLLHFTENMPGATDIRFTFLMQLGVVIGTITAYPAVRALTARRSPSPHPSEASAAR